MKKIAVALLALAIVLTTVLVPILADGDAVTTVGYSSARIKKANLTEVPNIKDYDEGTFQWAYKITDVAGLVKLSEIVNGGNSLKRIYIHLAADLDMSAVENFQPIGTRAHVINAEIARVPVVGDGTEGGVHSSDLTSKSNESVPFEGQFDGRGHVIDNLDISINAKETLYGGLFGYVKNATITNVVMGAGSSIESTYNGSGACAGIVGFATGVTVIDNCYNLASVCADSQTKLEADPTHNFAVHAAGILGRGAATITNCTNAGTMVGVKSAGGIMGYKEGSTVVVTNCRNTGAITGDKAGGISSRAVTLETCINNGPIKGRDFAGGLIGGDNNAIIKNSINYAAVETIAGGTETGDPVANPLYAGTTADTNLVNNQAKVGDTDTTLTTDIETITPAYGTVDEAGEETAYTTYETQAATQEIVIGENTSPTGNEIGFSTVRIQKVDLTNVPDIKNFSSAGAEADAFKITDVDGWFYLDRLFYEFNVFTDMTIYLATDLDFSGVDNMRAISYDTESWTSTVPSPMYFFGGIFDGQGYQICNAKINEEWDGNTVVNGEVVANNAVAAGLFAYVQGATFKNVIIDESCSFKTTSKAAYPIVGALTAHAGSSVTIDNCWNKANVSGARQAGGFVGRTNTSTDFHVSNLTNSGNITATFNPGGIAGYVDIGKNALAEDGITVTNCRNVGKITGTDITTAAGTAASGFLARTWSPTVFDTCINNGDVSSAGTNVGAFVGTTKRAVTLKNCKNFALLYEDAPVGRIGLVGCSDNTDPDPALLLTIENSEDLYGMVDPTLMYEKLPDPVFPIPVETTAATTEAATTVAATTETPATEATTTGAAATTAGAAATNAANDDTTTDVEVGCKSTVVGSFALLALMGGAALTILKKKED